MYDVSSLLPGTENQNCESVKAEREEVHGEES